jgi:regulator of protease activity HflC (stomatin/prohibitin superfamily)
MKKLLLSIIAISATACSQVNNGETGVQTNFGKAQSPALSPGLYFYMPFVSTIHILNTKVQTVEQDSQAASNDLQNVQTQITLNYHLGTQDPVSHYTRLGDNQEQIEASIVKPAMSEAFKAVVAQYTAEQLITKRAIVSVQIESTLAARLKQYDLYIDSVSITNFKFSEAYSNAVEAKQVAEQNAGKAKNDLVTATINAQQKVVEAKANADAMQLQKQVVTPELIALKQLEIQSKAVDKWDGAFPQTYMSGNSPMTMLNLGSK